MAAGRRSGQEVAFGLTMSPGLAAVLVILRSLREVLPGCLGQRSWPAPEVLVWVLSGASPLLPITVRPVVAVVAVVHSWLNRGQVSLLSLRPPTTTTTSPCDHCPPNSGVGA